MTRLTATRSARVGATKDETTGVSILVRLCERVFQSDRVYAVFKTPGPPQPSSSDPQVECFDRDHPPDAELLAEYARCHGRLFSRLMFGRLRSGDAVLLALREGPALIANGWLQVWHVQRREFYWLSDDGVCLGPFWTAPEQRGRGLYGRLIRASLHESALRFPGITAFIWALAGNAASIRGIQKAGFTPLGLHRVTTYALGLIRRHKKLAEAVEGVPRP